jgi:YQGE family putative transporter
LFIGRAFGMGLFISLAYWISEDFALKYALVIVGGIQLLSLPLAKNIINDIDTKYNKFI